MKVSDEETLRRFVVRARRVQAHSLVQDQARLARHAAGELKLHVDMAGRTTVIREPLTTRRSSSRLSQGSGH